MPPRGSDLRAGVGRGAPLQGGEIIGRQLHRRGFEPASIVGRLGRITGERAQFSGSLTNTCTLADLKLARLLDRMVDLAIRPRASA